MPIEPEATTTLRDLVADGGWVIVNCDNVQGCGRRVATRLTAFIQKYGPRESSNVVRANAVCLACGTKGCTITMPSWAGADRGWAEFPGEGVEITASKFSNERPW
jgi:hypothetical protein